MKRIEYRGGSDIESMGKRRWEGGDFLADRTLAVANDFKRGWKRRSKVAVRRGMRHVSSREFPRLGLPWQRDLTRLGAKQREPL